LLAAQILALEDPELRERLARWRQEQARAAVEGEPGSPRPSA
jgi:phosphoribosylcarboxyaminoimidazole (NCAIR) mutase